MIEEVPMPDQHMTCGCVIELDKLRMRHEEGKVEAFIVIELDEKGEVSAFTHNTNTPILMAFAQTAIQMARGEEDGSGIRS